MTRPARFSASLAAMLVRSLPRVFVVVLVFVFVVVVVLVSACASAGRTRIDRPEELPPHAYVVPPDVGRLVIDAAAFAELSRQVRSHLEGELARYDIRDTTTLEDRLFVLSLLDALDDRWAEAVGRLDAIAAVEADPRAKAMTGLTIRVWADARAHGGTDPRAFRQALERKLASLPVAQVRPQLAMLRAMGQTFTPDVCKKLIEDSIGAEAKTGALSLESIHALAFQRYAVVHLVPVGEEIDHALAAAGVAVPVDAEDSR
jgi:hypothetical protein